MEYIKKEELKDGDVFVSQMSRNHFLNKYGTGYSLNLNLDNTIKNQVLYRNGGLAYNNMRLATSEEKHWLNCCITADKFITFEEAMKTFIPEYVECIQTVTGITIGKILSVENNIIIDGTFNNYSIKATDVYKYFKPSTKEAYDSQFVVKEPAENKTELEIWLENTKSLNLSLEDLEKYIESNQTCNFDNIYMKLEGHYSKGRAKILFDKWNEKVIEPLPQFKVIETIETITKVENNEGNQFFIGDKVKTLTNNIYIITGFKYNENKTNILAIFDNKNSFIIVGIDKIEHYIEPKVEETLLEKAKRLYPIGTEYICAYSGHTYDVSSQNFEQISNSKIHAENLKGCLLYEDKWAEIIK